MADVRVSHACTLATLYGFMVLLAFDPFTLLYGGIVFFLVRMIMKWMFPGDMVSLTLGREI